MSNATSGGQSLDAFVASFCATSDYASFASPGQGITFSFAEFSPCFNDIVVLGGCNAIMILLVLLRLFHMCRKSLNKYYLKQPAKGIHTARTAGCFLISVITCLQLSGRAGSTQENEEEMQPFEIISFSLTALAWSWIGLVMLIELSGLFEKNSHWLMTFSVALQQAGYTIKLYYLVETRLRENEPLFASFFQILFLAQFVLVSCIFLSFCHVPGDAHYTLSRAVGGGKAVVMPGDIALDDLGDKGTTQEGVIDDEASAHPLPESQSSCCSRLTFGWMSPLLKLGYKTPLTAATIFALPRWEQSAPLSQRFQQQWDKELQRKRQGKRISLVRALRRSSLSRTHSFRVCACTGATR